MMLKPLKENKKMLLALDRSARTKDADQHLRIEHNLLTRACVSDYDGSEIPSAAEFGWKPGTMYALYRDPEALRAAVPGLEGKPLLLQHRPITADDHPKSLVVGCITNPVWDEAEQAVYGDLVIWDEGGILAIEAKELPALSLGYRYDCVPQSGVAPDGSKYSGVMKNIQMNHCALVETPRIKGAVVADSAPVSRVGRKPSNGEIRMKIARAFGLDCRAKDEEENPAAELHRRLAERFEAKELKEIGALIAKLTKAEEAAEGEEESRNEASRFDEFEPDDAKDTELPERERGKYSYQPEDPEERREYASKDEADPWERLKARRMPKAGAPRKIGAMDAAARLAFDRRYPSLARVSVDTSVVLLTDDGRPQSIAPRQSGRQSSEAELLARFPALARIRAA